MKTIGIIVNANAKMVRRGRLSLDLIRQIGSDMVDLRVTKDFNELDTALRDFRREDYPYIAIAGGDGTIHHTVTRAMNIYGEGGLPQVLLLKGGTMDNVARSVGLRGSSTEILSRMMMTIRRGREPEERVRGTMKIENRYCSLFGIGFVINFMHECYGGREKGTLQNCKAIGKAIRHALHEPSVGSLYEGLEAEVTVDGGTLSFTYITAILAGTVEGVGMGFNPLSKSTRSPESFHALITGMNGRQILSRILSLKQGWEIRHPLVCDAVAQNLRIEAKARFTYTMDGDFYESSGSCLVTAGPRIRYLYV